MALAAYPADAFWIFPAMILAGAVGGWAWGMIPAMLRNWFGASEILSRPLMLRSLCRAEDRRMDGLRPDEEPEGYGFPGSRNLQQYDAASNPN